MLKPPPLPKRSQTIARRMLVELAIAVLFALIWRLQLMRDVNARIATIRALGLPTTGAELNDFYPAVPDERNSALVITQAFGLMRYYSDARSNLVANFRMPSATVALTTEQRNLLADYVEMNGTALAKAREGLSLPKSRYPIDMAPGFSALLPHLRPLKDLAQLASYKGVLATDSGQPAEAVRSVVTMLKLSRTLGAEPLLISKLVRFRINKMAADTLERCLNAGSLDDQQLSMLGREFGDGDQTNELVRALIGERAVAMPLFRMNFAEFDRFANSPERNPLGADESPGSVMLTFLIRTTGFFERDFRFYLKVMETNVSFASVPPPKSLSITNSEAKASTEIRRWHYMISGVVLPASSKAYLRHAESLAALRLAQTVLAVERFRLSGQRLPSDLDELVPDFLPQIQADPFDGAPLRYKLLSKGYVVYSIGPDGHDDGGKEPPTKRRSTARVPEDITFTVER